MKSLCHLGLGAIKNTQCLTKSVLSGSTERLFFHHINAPRRSLKHFSFQHTSPHAIPLARSGSTPTSAGKEPHKGEDAYKLERGHISNCCFEWCIKSNSAKTEMSPDTDTRYGQRPAPGS